MNALCWNLSANSSKVPTVNAIAVKHLCEAMLIRPLFAHQHGNLVCKTGNENVVEKLRCLNNFLVVNLRLSVTCAATGDWETLTLPLILPQTEKASEDKGVE